ncbi:NADPH-dependent FMN reductase [Immundisolibacter sp.]|uniref:NADPH-dependent FMN reductase n=1 Tax=Immundisolibacter sp. TaxID=1934948 RepID=UPI002B07FCC3|nr:NADPH-dependent FMN reductase [Immundisolibacter sp.]MEA3220738.1 NAD(P)H-dependent FMN reductase [Immundisolibacter sp.]
MTTPLKILGLCGSLRQGSFNQAALRVAQELAPAAGLSIESADIADVPLYNEDVYAQGFPPPVERLREQIRAADGLLFVTPEYNYSIPGVLKNAIDWVSRPPEQPFAGKPAAVMGASPSTLGTARAQYHLRQSLVCLDVHFLNAPEVMIASAHTRFDAQCRLTDEPTREIIGKLLEALAAWTQRLKPA